LRIGMTVEANIVFRQKASAVVVPVDAVVANAVQQVSNGVVRRVPIVTGIRGTQFVEVVSGLPAGATVLSPARTDLADGARVQTAGAALQGTVASATGADSPGADSGAGASVARQETKFDNSVDRAISAAISAHVQSIVNDARRSADRSR